MRHPTLKRNYRSVETGTLALLSVLCMASVLLSGCTSVEDRSPDRRLFCYNASDGVRSIDPGKATDLEAMWVVDQLYEGLLELDEQLQVRPALAEAWSVSEDGLQYRFRLRKDAVFHDGSPLVARDVALSFERLLDPTRALPGRWVLSDLAPEGVAIVSDDSLILSLSRAQPVFPGLLATPQAGILKGGGLEGNPDSEDMGSGPFALKGWIPETAMVLHRFEGYWMRDDQGRNLPYLDGVRIEFNREPGAEYLGFRQGRYDFVSALDPEWVNALKDETGKWKPEWKGRFKVHEVPYLKTDYVGFLVDSAALDQGGFPRLTAPIRRAMSMALDREALVRELRADEAVPAEGFVPSGMPGFSNDQRQGRVDLAWHPDVARSILAEAGIGPEPPLERLGGLTLGTKPGAADLASALQFTWAEFGIDVAIDVAPSAIDAERVARSQVPLFRKSWLADYPDAENFLGLFLPDRWCPNGPNYTHFSDSSVTALLNEASHMVPGREREAVLRKAEGHVLDAMPVIPLWHDQVVHLVSSQWTGWKVSPTNRLDLRHVRSVGP